MLSLCTKILAVAAALVLLSQAGTVSVVLVSAHQDVSDRATRSLQTGLDVFRKAASSRAIQYENTVRALASDYGFKQAVGTADPLTAESALANHAERAGADIAFLIDRNRNVLASARGANGPGVPVADELLAEFADNAGHRSLVVDDAVYEVFTVPVRAPLPIAWLTMGFRLTDDYARQLSDLTNLDATIYAFDSAKPQVVATSMDKRWHVSLARSGRRLLANAGPSTVGIGGDEFLAVSTRLVEDQPEVQILLSKSLSEAMEPFALLRTASFALGAWPLLAALIGAVLLSRALTQPVQRLMRATRRIQAGDYRSPVDIRSGDELSQFGVAFNAMQREIATREERIRHQARHDSVTGLLNAEYALDYLREQIVLADRTGDQVAVLAVTLNAQHDISGTFGHEVYLAYLAEAARNLRRFVDSSSVLARTDSDAFLVIFNETESSRARDVGQDLHERFRPGIRLPAVNVTIDPHIGIAVYPDHGSSAEQVLQRAIIANSEAEADGRPARFYRHGDEDRLRKNMILLQDLPRAAEHDEFRVFCQPKIRLADETVSGVEVLLRWDHPEYGWLPPDQFIPLIERSGNISVVSRWILEKTVLQHRQWRESGLDISVAVNLSAHDLLDRDLPWFVIDLVKKFGLPPEKLVLEITEEAMVSDFANAVAVLDRLHSLGIRIAIDDFGTGYSSLEQLKNLPVDQLKIDKCFVAGIPDDSADAAIVSTAVDLAEKLNLSVVAEGVETSAAMRWLRDYGVAEAQGFYWSKPISADKFVEWIADFDGGRTRQNRVLKLR